MTQEAFTEALQNARASGPEAMKALAETQLPLVGMLLRRFPWHQVEREDLFQQGCVGLMKALEGFNPALGNAFSTYAVPIILGEMRKLLRTDTPLHIPRTDLEKRTRIRQMQRTLWQQLAREPTMDELAGALSLEPAELALQMEAITVTSIDTPTIEDGAPLSEKLPDERTPWLERIMLRDLISRLPEEDQQLLHLRHHQGLTQAETAREMGVHQSWVSRREAALTARLRSAWRDE